MKVVDGKFVFKVGDTKEKHPSERFLIPIAKTERIKFFNSITRDIYDAAFADLQTQFPKYLNVQRKFQWEVRIKQDMKTDLYINN